MSKKPDQPGQPGVPPPPYYGVSSPWHPALPQYSPQFHHPHPVNPSINSDCPPSAPYPVFIPGAVTTTVPVGPPLELSSQSTYITNNIYTSESSTNVSSTNSVQSSEDFEWVPSTPSTARLLAGKAVIAGHEGWDRSPLWVIRAWHKGDLIPGKFIVKRSVASVSHDRKEFTVKDIEVLCAKQESCLWIPDSYGNVPSGAVPGGGTVHGETLYIARARQDQSIIPGKVHPSHKRCYIGFAGGEIAHKTYDVLCRSN